MSQAITLLGASYSNVPAIELPKTGGGIARFDDCSVVTASASDVASGKIFVASDGTITTGTSSGGGGGNYSWFGPNTVKDYTKTITINLANDTSWNSWTASTTATSILGAPTTADFTYSFNMNTDVALFVCTAIINYTLKPTATKILIPISTGRTDWYNVFGFPLGYDNFKSFTIGTTSTTTLANDIRLYYYNSSGDKSTGTISYGVYHYGTPTYSINRSGSTITIGGKRNAIYARCGSNYFDTARKADIDADNTNVVITFDVYKIPREGSFLVHNINDTLTAMNAAPEA